MSVPEYSSSKQTPHVSNNEKPRKRQEERDTANVVVPKTQTLTPKDPFIFIIFNLFLFLLQ